MSQKEKLIKRLFSRPKDMTFEEVVTLLGYYGYSQISTGQSTGSLVVFSNDLNNDYIRFHKPHPQKLLKAYQIKDLIDVLSERRLIT